MATLEELITPITAEEMDQQLIALAQANDLPTTSWSTGSTARELLRIMASAISDSYYSVAQIANGVIIELSSGEWLTRLAKSIYDEERGAAVRTVGQVLLTDNGGGPHTVTAGVFVVSTAGRALQYRATTGGTLALNGTLTIDVSAVGTGAIYNVPNLSIVELVTAAPTVTVSNPEIGVTGTWITTLGLDIESDSELRHRLPLKWATLSEGSPEAAYESWALEVDGVTRARVDASNPDGPGSNRLYIDNAGSVAAVQAVLDARVPSGTLSTCVAAAVQNITVPAVITVKRAQHDSAAAEHISVLTALASEIQIGGKVIKSEIIERLMATSGVVDVMIGTGWAAIPPSENIQLAGNSIAQFTASFLYLDS